MCDAVANAISGVFSGLYGGTARFERLIALFSPHVPRTESMGALDLLKLQVYVQLWRGQWDAVLALCESIWAIGERLGVLARASLGIGALVPLCATIRGDYAAADAARARLFQHLEPLEPAAPLDTLRPVLAECAAERTPGFIMWQGQIVVPLLRLAITHGVHAGFAAQVLALLGAPIERPAPTAGQSVAGARRLLNGGETLTEREVEVLRLLAAGASNPEIAARLIISPYTVKRHVANLLGKFGASSRTEAAMRATWACSSLKIADNR